jgi:putative transposase
MACLPRITVPGVAHHVTQRGNRRQTVFWQADDYALYRDLLADQCSVNGLAVWACCLMPNYVHFILVPCNEDALSRAIGETHRRYTGYINARLRMTGHLFHGRFGSIAMNPVKAQLIRQASDWPWASPQAHLAAREDKLVSVQRQPSLGPPCNKAVPSSLDLSHECW